MNACNEVTSKIAKTMMMVKAVTQIVKKSALA